MGSLIPVSLTLLLLGPVPTLILFHLADPNGTIGGIPRIDNYEKIPQMDRILGPSFRHTDNDLEWSLAAYAELYDTRWAISDTVGRVKNSIWTSRRISQSVILIGLCLRVPPHVVRR